MLVKRSFQDVHEATNMATASSEKAKMEFSCRRELNFQYSETHIMTEQYGFATAVF